MNHFSMVALVALVCLRSAAANNSDKVLMDSLRQVPVGWEKAREASLDHAIHLRIALEQPGLEIFEETLYKISTPQHPNYGHFLSRDDLQESMLLGNPTPFPFTSMMKPHQQSTKAVVNWLHSSGVSALDVKDAGEWVNFNTPVGNAQALLNTTFAVYSFIGTNVEVIRTLRNIDPDCLRDLYKIGNYTADSNVSSIVGVAGFLEEGANFSALEQFLKQFAPYATSQNFSYVLVNGGQDDQPDTTHDSGEGNLDVQYVAGLGYNTDIRYYSTGGRGPMVPIPGHPDQTSRNEPYLDPLAYLLPLPNEELPRTLTVSYGEIEDTVPQDYAKKVCDMFGQLGARGVSVIFSSGDYGVGNTCLSNDGKNTTSFEPLFPAACPYVTSVGVVTEVEPESAFQASSGGFSNIWPRPAYQNASVTNYLQKIGDRYKGFYNQSGRGFPDVAAQANNVLLVNYGPAAPTSGTSASAPIFASIISLLNNARIKKGMSPVGFLNPWLYSTALEGGGWTDITTGGSCGCSFKFSSSTGQLTPHRPWAAWNATEGWDPVTGLGTPLFGQLLELAVASYSLSRLS